MEISLCMIVKNEEDVLEKCLHSVCDLMDEIIIVDTGSTDRTKEIAARYTDKIYDFVWIDDFSAARNFSFSKATKDYCMWLDADDILTDKNRDAFLLLKNSLSADVDVVYMTYHYMFTEDGRLEGSLVRERIVKRAAGFIWKGQIHEVIDVSGNIIKSDVIVTHTRTHRNSDRNFLLLEQMIKNGSNDLKTLFYYASELPAHMRADESIEHMEAFFSRGGQNSAFCLAAYLFLHERYMEKKQYNKILKLSADCMPFCTNRAEYCCQLGYFYNNVIKDTEEATYWFDKATKCPYPAENTFVVLEQYYYYIPYVQLGNAYCKQRRLIEGLACFKEALRYQPDNDELPDIISKLQKLISKISE